MQIKQLKSIHHWIRSTSLSEVFFVSILVYPLFVLMYFQAWEVINDDISIDVAITASFLYFLALIIMKSAQSRQEKNKRYLNIVVNHMLDKKFEFISFERLIELDKKLTEKRLIKLRDAFPNKIRLARLEGNKPGIKILNIEIENES